MIPACADLHFAHRLFHMPLDLFRWNACLILLAAALTTGCGTTRQYTATEQLVMSDAVDRSIGRIDFRPLSGRRVYLDTSYLRHVKGEGFVNAEYVTSALRQQIVAAGCLIQDANSDAEISSRPASERSARMTTESRLASQRTMRWQPQRT